MITVLKPGLLTTIQDAGRPGWRAFGMPLAGALDRDAYEAANLLAGNDAGAAAIELTLLGGTFRFDVGAVVAVAGADLQPTLDGAAVATWSSFAVRAGAELTFAGTRGGCRAYLAVRGGIDVPVVLGSRATYTRARVGGLEGRALRKGDVLRVASVRPEPVEGRTDAVVLPQSLIPRYERAITLRAILGPQDDRFLPEAIEAFLGTEFQVTNRNDRMGYLLGGPTLRHVHGPDIVSDGVLPGSVQVPGSGSPIVMMADCATVGGYTKLATVISADLPRLAQAKAGDTVRFARCDQARAVDALRRREAWLASVAQAARSGRTSEEAER